MEPIFHIVNKAREIALKYHDEQYVLEHLDHVAQLVQLTDSYKIRTDKDDLVYLSESRTPIYGIPAPIDPSDAVREK